MLKMFTTIDEVYSWLYNQRKSKKRENLDRITRCALELNLKPDYKIIHIAGTNGKGSVAASIKSVLMHTGRHVGLFVSPYVISFNERIEINDRYISDAEIMHYSNILYEYSKEYEKKYNDIIPFFELTLLMALMYFKDRKIDLAVIECGLGGLLDATNFLDTDLAIITNIGYDHMAQLGNTLEEIAYHKLGIVKNGIPLITAVDNKLLPLFKEYCNNKNSKLIYVNPFVKNINTKDMTTFTYKDIDYKVSLLGEYQAYNASIAIEAIKYIEPNIPYDLIDYGLKNVFWPGRMEIISNNPLIILDGGHNIHAISATTNSLSKIKGNRKFKTLFTALKDKDYNSMLEELDKITDFYYFTSIEDLRSTDPIEFTKNRSKEYLIDSNINSILIKAITELKEDEILFITGSLHFISVVRDEIKKIIK